MPLNSLFKVSVYPLKFSKVAPASGMVEVQYKDQCTYNIRKIIIKLLTYSFQLKELKHCLNSCLI